MTKEETLKMGLDLANKSTIVMCSTIDDKGFPNTRAMMKLGNQELKEIWSITNVSSRKVPHIKMNQKACMYFVDFIEWTGLMLVGTIEILQDLESKKRFWRDELDKYFRLGINDPDCAIIHFTANQGQYYHSFNIVNFEL